MVKSNYPIKDTVKWNCKMKNYIVICLAVIL